MPFIGSSGTLSMDTLRSFFGAGSVAPFSMSQLYRGGTYVPSTKTVSEGPFGSVGSPAYWWRDDGVDVYWNGSLIASTVGAATSFTTGGYTYFKGTVFYTQTGEYSSTSYNSISRSSSVAINGNVPTSGTISVSNFYGAEEL